MFMAPVISEERGRFFTPFWNVGYKKSNRQFENPNNLTKLERKLFCLVRGGNVKDLIIFLHKNKIGKNLNINIEDETTNETALLIAVRLGYDECIKVLVMKGAVIDCLNSKHKNAIQEAIYSDKLSTVETIFTFISDINTRQLANGNSYLHLAAGCKSLDIFNFIRAKCGYNMIRIKNSLQEMPYDVGIRSSLAGPEKLRLMNNLIKLVLEEVEERIKALYDKDKISQFKICEDICRVIAQFVADEYSNKLNVSKLLNIISPNEYNQIKLSLKS